MSLSGLISLLSKPNALLNDDSSSSSRSASFAVSVTCLSADKQRSPSVTPLRAGPGDGASASEPQASSGCLR